MEAAVKLAFSVSAKMHEKAQMRQDLPFLSGFWSQMSPI